jgi:hypothetical protein
MTWTGTKEFCWSAARRCRPYRDAFVYLVYGASFSLLPTLSAFLLLKAFDRWNGDWARLLASGNLLTASASLMANALYAFRTKENSESFLNSISGLIATLIIAFSCLFYAGLVLVNQQILPPDVHMSPDAVILSSVILYLCALFVTYRVLVVQHKKLPSNPEVRDDQVRNLEQEFKNTHE